MPAAPDAPVAVITGASGHLGRAVATLFATAGYRLLLTSTSQASLDAAFPAVPRSSLLAVDLATRTAAGQLEAAASGIGRVDALCCLAGAFAMGPPVHDDEEGFRAMMQANVETLRTSLRALVPLMLGAGRGHIVTVGAASAVHGRAGMGAYTAAKSVVMRLTEALAAELGPKGITANCVLPGILDTAANRAAMPDADRADWVPLDKLAAAIAFLCSQDASAINGALIPVTGRSGT